MRPRLALSLVVALASALCLVADSQTVKLAPNENSALRVNEQETRLEFQDKGALLNLRVLNDAGRAIQAKIRVEILDAQDRVRAKSETQMTVAAGASTIELPLDVRLAELKKDERKDLLLERLRYSIEASGASDAAASYAASGVASLAAITPDVFDLRVIASEKARENSSYIARVRAAHPVTSKPIAGVEIEGAITIHYSNAADYKRLIARAATDANGDATLIFRLPSKIEDEELKLSVSARRGGFAQEASENVSTNQLARFLVTTDKPLYQPGQTLHARVLAFDANRRALADTDISFVIRSASESDKIFRAETTTSRFGIANIEWQIPDNAKLGQFFVEASIKDKESTSLGSQLIRISRYDLPNFAVSVKPDRSFYLPNQNAEVTVRADYLFGEQVKRGHVRIVRETERTWNYDEQKYETKEAETYEGETDAEGKFVAHVDLQKAHDELNKDSYARFRDLNFAAYFTDPTTNRTEQRRFDLRVTREPVHVYVIGGRYRNPRGLPLTLYVSASYADGATARDCDVRIAAIEETRTTHGKRMRVQAKEKPLAEARTNRYGVARITLPAALIELSLVKSSDDPETTLKFTVRDGESRTGSFKEDYRFDDSPALRVETDKAIYRPGEAIEVNISSNQHRGQIFVDIAREGGVLESQAAGLQNGRARLKIPYDAKFSGFLTVGAFSSDCAESNYQPYISASRAILFPADRELKLGVNFDKTEYRPGDAARVDLTVKDASGKEIAGALGVVVFDKAVAERARTDAEFGSSGSYGFGSYFYDYYYGSGSIGGVTLRDLETLDAHEPIAPELQLVAELALSRQNYYEDYEPKVFGGDALDTNQAEAYAPLVHAQLNKAEGALTIHYNETTNYAKDETQLRQLLAANGIDFDSLKDPWGTPYRARFSVDKQLDVLELRSAGADKKFDTADDWTALKLAYPYFRPLGEKINEIVSDFHERTGRFIRDAATFKNELRANGIDFDALRDRWGKPYTLKFGLMQTLYTISIESGGADGAFEPETKYPNDDFAVWSIASDYFAEARSKIDFALAVEVKNHGKFPTNEHDFRLALRRAGIDFDALRDARGYRFYATFRNESRYVNRVVTRSGPQNNQRTTITPVTANVAVIYVRSAGADGRRGTGDDFNAAEFSSVAAEETAADMSPQPAPKIIPLKSGGAAISGTVTDPIGAVVPNAKIVLTNDNYPNVSYQAQTNDEGKYLFRNLPSGIYNLRCEATGFKSGIIGNVYVFAMNLTQVDITLQVGAASETVNVTASGPPAMETASMSATVSERQIRELPTNGKASDLVELKEKSGATLNQQIVTPRLREYFPETLLWQPEVETDAQGRAHVDFKLADNITTWRMSVIGSTVDGQIGTAETEFRAFQKFFVEHDPPKVLTIGDEIALPVVIRSYTNAAQSVNVSMKPESWFQLLDAQTKQENVPAQDASRAVFRFRATSATDEGRQRVTALNASDASDSQEANDAIERAVRVHPDGEEITKTASQVFSERGALETEIPSAALPNTARAELKIYPNLLAHVAESVEGILQRPYGCGEQTISSTYPSLLLLKATKGRESGSPLTAEAQKYLRQGYERLLNYRSADGGFSYWGRGDSDFALTAYALRFLTDAREFLPVDEDAINEARAFLIKHQRADGSWLAHAGYEKDSRRIALDTAYIARTLAETLREAKDETNDAAAKKARDEANAALQRALKFLKPRVDEIDEPYMLASYALAARATNDAPEFSRTVARLRTLAHEEHGASYWNLETNTPFYGWGLAGRIETTALVVEALASSHDDKSAASDGEKNKTLRDDDKRAASANGEKNQSSDLDPLVSRGALFLLRNKDRYGVWYSTQATVNVLNALIKILRERSAQNSSQASSAQIFVNDELASTLELPHANQLTNPIAVDLSRLFRAGANRVEIRLSSNSTEAAAQVLTSYYVAWKRGEDAQAQALRLRVDYDKTQLAPMQEVTCRVHAERVGFKGYGMMLAEIGLPPGAEVDRASLERAGKDSGWSVSQYDVLPDRVIVYLWSQAGGSDFNFKFKPRYAINAQTSASTLYDYYNPNARATLAPTRFIVK